MSHIRRFLIFLTLAANSATALGKPLIYVLGLGAANAPQFGTVDLSSGLFANIGLTGVASGSIPACLGYAQDGTLYAEFSTAQSSGLYTINPANGSATLVANIQGTLAACAMTASGVMYGVAIAGANVVLYSISLSTGAPSQIGAILPAPNPPSFRTALTAANNTLYLAFQPSTASNSTLYTVSTSTGSGTAVGSTDAGIVGLAYASGTLYAFTSPVFGSVAAPHIDIINLTNGASAFVTNLSPPTAYIKGGVPVTGSVPASTTPTITSLDNGASFTPKSTAAPGAFLTLKGTGLGSAESLGVYPATQANGVSVTINGITAPIFDLEASGGTINLLAPSELPSTGTVPVQLKTANGTSSVFTLNMAATVPAMFGLTDPNKPTRRNALAVDSTTSSVAMPISMAEGIAKTLGLPPDYCTAANPTAYCGQPASAGDTIVLYATGLGIATPNGDPAGQPLLTGQAAPADGSVIYNSVATPVVTIGGAPAALSSSAIAPGFAGLYQINVQIPASAPTGDDVPITLSVAGSSTDTATIAIH
jgi:uncharacterized protein (TIGR03437 family)